MTNTLNCCKKEVHIHNIKYLHFLDHFICLDQRNVVEGRPNLSALLQSEKNSKKTAVFVCGPHNLVLSTREVCIAYDLDMHEEIFEF